MSSTLVDTARCRSLTGIIVNAGILGQAVVPLVGAAIYTTSGIVGLFTVVAGMYVGLAILAVLALETFDKKLESLYGEA